MNATFATKHSNLFPTLVSPHSHMSALKGLVFPVQGAGCSEGALANIIEQLTLTNDFCSVNDPLMTTPCFKTLSDLLIAPSLQKTVGFVHEKKKHNDGYDLPIFIKLLKCNKKSFVFKCKETIMIL